MATKAFKDEKMNALKESVSKAKVAIVTEYKGLTVAEITKLRRSLQAEGGDYTVTKNTLAKLAVKDTPFESLSDILVGSTAVAFGFNDEVSPAKVVAQFIKDSKKDAKVSIKGGALDGKFLTAEEVNELSKLPSKEELYAKMLGSINSPASGIANSLNAVIRSLVIATEAVRKQKESA